MKKLAKIKLELRNYRLDYGLKIIKYIWKALWILRKREKLC